MPEIKNKCDLSILSIHRRIDKMAGIFKYNFRSIL